MNKIKYQDKILEILDEFGMSGAKASEAMKISYGSFRNKKNDASGRSFNEQNYIDLIQFIKNKANDLKI